MPEPTPPAAPAAAPTPTPPPAPAPADPPPAPAAPPADPPPTDPTPTEPTEPVAVEPFRDPLLDAMLRDMNALPEPDIKKVDEEPKPDPATPPAPGAPPTDPPAAPPKPKKRTTIVDIDPMVADPATTPPAPAAPAAPPAQPPTTPPAKPDVDPDAAYIATLNEAQQAELEEAEVAERHMPTKYTGQKTKLLAWNKKLDATVDKLRKENPERTFDESDQEFQQFLRTKPVIQAFDQRKVLLTMAEDRAVERIKREQAPQFDEVKRRQRHAEIEPQVKKNVDMLAAAVTDFTTEGDEKDPLTLAARAFKADPVKAAEEYPLEVAVIQDKINQARETAHEYSLLVNGVKSFDKNNEAHKWIIEFIHKQGQYLASQSNEVKLRDGKMFLPREEYANVTAGDRHKYWTFDHRDVMQLLMYQTRAEMVEGLKREEELAQKKGLERRKPKSSAVPPSPAPPASPPPADPPTQVRAKPTPGRGAAIPANPPSALPSDVIDVVSTLKFET